MASPAASSSPRAGRLTQIRTATRLPSRRPAEAEATGKRRSFGSAVKASICRRNDRRRQRHSRRLTALHRRERLDPVLQSLAPWSSRVRPALTAAVERGDWSVAASILRRDPSAAASRCSHNALPLHAACRRAPLPPLRTMDALLEAHAAGAAAEDRWGHLPLHLALRSCGGGPESAAVLLTLLHAFLTVRHARHAPDPAFFLLSFFV